MGGPIYLIVAFFLGFTENAVALSCLTPEYQQAIKCARGVCRLSDWQLASILTGESCSTHLMVKRNSPQEDEGPYTREILETASQKLQDGVYTFTRSPITEMLNPGADQIKHVANKIEFKRGNSDLAKLTKKWYEEAKWSRIKYYGSFSLFPFVALIIILIPVLTRMTTRKLVINRISLGVSLLVSAFYGMICGYMTIDPWGGLLKGVGLVTTIFLLAGAFLNVKYHRKLSTVQPYKMQKSE